MLTALCAAVYLPGRRLWHTWRAHGALHDGRERTLDQLSQHQRPLSELGARLARLSDEARALGCQPDDVGPYQRSGELLNCLAQAREQLDDAHHEFQRTQHALEHGPTGRLEKISLYVSDRYYKSFGGNFARIQELRQRSDGLLDMATDALETLRKAPFLVVDNYRDAVALKDDAYTKLDQCQRDGLGGPPLEAARRQADHAAARLGGLPAYFTSRNRTMELLLATHDSVLDAWEMIEQCRQDFHEVRRLADDWCSGRRSLEAARADAIQRWREAHRVYSTLPATISPTQARLALRRLVAVQAQLAPPGASLDVNMLQGIDKQLQALAQDCDSLAAQLRSAIKQAGQLQGNIGVNRDTLDLVERSMRDALQLRLHPLLWPQSQPALRDLRHELARLGPPQQGWLIDALDQLLRSALQLAQRSAALDSAVQESLRRRAQYHQLWQQERIPAAPDWLDEVQQLVPRVSRYDDQRWRASPEIAGLLSDSQAVQEQSERLQEQHRELCGTHHSKIWVEAGVPPTSRWPAVDRALEQLSCFAASRAQLHDRTKQCKQLLNDLELREHIEQGRLAQLLDLCDQEIQEAGQILQRLGAATLYPVASDTEHAALLSAQQERAAAELRDARPVLPQIEAALGRASAARDQIAAQLDQARKLAATHSQLCSLHKATAPIADSSWLQAPKDLRERSLGYAAENWPAEDRPHELLADCRALQGGWRTFSSRHPHSARSDTSQLVEAHSELSELSQRVRQFVMRYERIRKQLDELKQRETGLRHQMIGLKGGADHIQSLLSQSSNAALAGLQSQWSGFLTQLQHCEAMLGQGTHYTIAQQENAVANLRAAYQARHRTLLSHLGTMLEELGHRVNDQRRRLASLNPGTIDLPDSLTPLRWELQQIVNERADLLDPEQDQLPRPQTSARGDRAIADLEALLASHERHRQRLGKLAFLVELFRFARDYQTCQATVEALKVQIDAGWPRVDGSIDDLYGRWRTLGRRITAAFERQPPEQLKDELAAFVIEVGQISDPLPQIAEQVRRQIGTIRAVEQEIVGLVRALQAVKHHYRRRRQMVEEIDLLLIDCDIEHGRLQKLPSRPNITHRQALDALQAIYGKLDRYMLKLEADGLVKKRV